MVTLETTKDLFFGLEDCDLCKFIELVTKFLPLPPKIIKMKKPNKDILNFSPTKTYPVLKSGDDFITGALPIVRYLIKSSKDISDGVLLDNRKILLGKNMREEAAIDTWTNYILTAITPITSEIKAQLHGKKKFEKELFDIALNDLIEALNSVNERLKLNTFLTSNTIQLADLMLASVLFQCFNEVLTQDKLEKIPNVTRMFKFISHMKKFEDIFGKYVPCKEQKAPEPFVEKPKEEKKEKEEKKKDKKNKGDKDNKEGENKEKKENKKNKEKNKEKNNNQNKEEKK
jgi:glutathione S-transferase